MEHGNDYLAVSVEASDTTKRVKSAKGAGITSPEADGS